MYYITINFRGRKPSRIRRKREFHGQNYHGLLETNHRWAQHAPNFAEKTFTDGLKIHESFLLYGIRSPLYRTKETIALIMCSRSLIPRDPSPW